MAQSSLVVALHYVLPVLWMMSRLATVGRMPARKAWRTSRNCVTRADFDVYERLFLSVPKWRPLVNEEVNLHDNTVAGN